MITSTSPFTKIGCHERAKRDLYRSRGLNPPCQGQHRHDWNAAIQTQLSALLSWKGVKPLHAETASFIAPAFTLRNIPMRENVDDTAILGDPEYPQRSAIGTTPSGYCPVNDACANVTAGTIGDILAERLRVQGVTAAVTDDAVRDSGDLEA